MLKILNWNLQKHMFFNNVLVAGKLNKRFLKKFQCQKFFKRFGLRYNF